MPMWLLLSDLQRNATKNQACQFANRTHSLKVLNPWLALTLQCLSAEALDALSGIVKECCS